MEAILACPEAKKSEIVVFIDGPKNAKSQPLVSKTEAVLRQILGTSATFVIASQNQGCRASIVSGVTQLCASSGKVIVIEDDLVVSPAFLSFMNDALIQLQDYPQVMHVCGYMYSVPEFRTLNHGLFFPFMIPWGWGTWADAWNLYDPNASDFDKIMADEQKRISFDFFDARDYSGMLRQQLTGNLDAWDILWYWSMFKNAGLGYFPPRTLVKNIGFDGSGTHGYLSAKLGVGRQRLATATTRYAIPEVSQCTGPLHKAMWKASARLGKQSLIYKVKKLVRALQNF